LAEFRWGRGYKRVFVQHKSTCTNACVRDQASLKHDIEPSAPLGRRGKLGAISVDLVPVVSSETSVQVNLVNRQPTSALPKPATEPEGKDDWKSKNLLEEVLGITSSSLAGRGDGDEDLSGEKDEAERETHHTAVDTTSSLEWDIVQRSTLIRPSLAEPDVRLLLVSGLTCDGMQL
jgi:hypothetical protein